MNKNVQITKISASSLSQNRAEEFGFDLSDAFVLPPIYEKIDFDKTAKPKIFIGGRGCGKTMLLRYLSHQTTFSQTKSKIEKSDLKNIGLYWKVDTHMVHQLQKRGLDNDVWQSAFEHIFTIHFSLEVLDSIQSIAKSNYKGFVVSDLNKLNFKFLKKTVIEAPSSFFEFKEFLESKISEFEFWLRNVRKGVQPLFYPKSFLKLLISDLLEQQGFLKYTVFNLYVDEYENLIEYQQEIINTWVKHSENPMVFHLAMKRNAFLTKKTIGNENLSDIHDYRVHDLEDIPNGKKGFMVFAAEILLHRLQGQINFQGFNFKPELLSDPNGFQERKSSEYQKAILNIVEQIFPSLSKKDLANEIIDDKILNKRLFDKLSQVLKNRKSELKAGEFIHYDDMRVSFVALSLLNRDNLKPEKIKDEIIKFKNLKPNNFSNQTDWIQNNFVGSYLYFYSSLNRVCPLYTGFRTFCEISSGNIRHLTELCYKTFLRASDKNTSDTIVEIWKITVENQAQAAKQASTTFLNEIKTFGRYGNQLHTFTHRLGTLFSLAHKIPKQSEPEQNHFSIVEGSERKEEVSLILNEAIKWSVLFEQKSTKKKSNSDPDFKDFILNPIYSPYFHISYRKKRKLEFSYETLKTLSRGSLEEYEGLLKSYTKKWDLDETVKEHDLFSDLKI